MFVWILAAEVDEADNSKDEKNDEKDEEKSEEGKADGGEEEEEEKDEEKKANGKEKGPGNVLKKVGTKKPNGKALSDIEIIDANLTNTKAENLQVLHAICWDAPGRANMVKKNLRRFNGFDFDDKSDEFKNRREAALKVELSKLKLTADVLDLDTKGTVEEIVDRIFTFLIKPEPQKPKSKKAAAPEPEEEEEEDEEADEEEDEEEGEAPKPKKVIRRAETKPASRSTTGRPRRATAGRNTAKGTHFLYDGFGLNKTNNFFFRQLLLRWLHKLRRRGSTKASRQTWTKWVRKWIRCKAILNFTDQAKNFISHFTF